MILGYNPWMPLGIRGAIDNWPLPNRILKELEMEVAFKVEESYVHNRSQLMKVAS